MINGLCEVLDKRQPPPTATQHEMLTRKFWTSREFFVVVGDATVWPTAENPLAWLAPYEDRPIRSGCISSLPPTSAAGPSRRRAPRCWGRWWGRCHGRRDNGAIISGVFAEPQRPGKAIYATATGTDGVLIGWTPPPTMPTAGTQTPSS